MSYTALQFDRPLLPFNVKIANEHDCVRVSEQGVKGYLHNKLHITSILHDNLMLFTMCMDKLWIQMIDLAPILFSRLENYTSCTTNQINVELEVIKILLLTLKRYMYSVFTVQGILERI